MKEAPSPITQLVLILAVKDGCPHVFVENTSESNLKVESGTCLGRAGAGRFQPSQDVSDDKKPYAWTFTRITNYKKDIAM